ncbi:hypothetical protein L596_020022 [Steinernema carpocapsae]|uniref:Uncharacterized protein n=1 Tax=Steinernema carpocapsae TaxID=34508 RepID=A0A4U5MSC1_STECR|nr:hypothetical protein L596_020022 [Steinernema carpocapsae]
MGLSLICSPVFTRILYMFITSKKYRSLECYRIMVHMGIVQLIFALGGILQACKCDPLKLGTHRVKIVSACIRTEAFLELTFGA